MCVCCGGGEGGKEGVGWDFEQHLDFGPCQKCMRAAGSGSASQCCPCRLRTVASTVPHADWPSVAWLPTGWNPCPREEPFPLRGRRRRLEVVQQTRPCMAWFGGGNGGGMSVPCWTLVWQSVVLQHCIGTSSSALWDGSRPLHSGRTAGPKPGTPWVAPAVSPGSKLLVQPIPSCTDGPGSEEALPRRRLPDRHFLVSEDLCRVCLVRGGRGEQSACSKGTRHSLSTGNPTHTDTPACTGTRAASRARWTVRGPRRRGRGRTTSSRLWPTSRAPYLCRHVPGRAGQ